MADRKFQVVFDGQLAPGANPARVKADVAKVFKSDVARVEPLFSGRRMVIKRGLDEATARKYQDVLERAGAMVSVVEAALDEAGATPALPSAPAASPAPAPPVAPPRPGSPSAEPADPEQAVPSRARSAEASRAPPPAATRGVPSAPDELSMAEPGALLVDTPTAVAAPDIDTSHLTLAAPGADLVERKKVPPSEFDLSDFELAPPGATLTDES